MIPDEGDVAVQAAQQARRGVPDADPQLPPALTRPMRPIRPIRWEPITQQYDQMIK
ncbi:hypothetical protein [Streptomyces prunicolor]